MLAIFRSSNLCRVRRGRIHLPSHKTFRCPISLFQRSSQSSRPCHIDFVFALDSLLFLLIGSLSLDLLKFTDNIAVRCFQFLGWNRLNITELIECWCLSAVNSISSIRIEKVSLYFPSSNTACRYLSVLPIY